MRTVHELPVLGFNNSRKFLAHCPSSVVFIGMGWGIGIGPR